MEAFTTEGVAVLPSLDIRHPKHKVLLATGLTCELIFRCIFLFDNHIMFCSIDDDTFTLKRDFFAENIATFSHLDRAYLHANQGKETITFALILTINYYPSL